MRTLFFVFFCLFALPALAGENAVTSQLPNPKLISMLRFYFLPFSIDFQQTKGSDEIVPKRLTQNGVPTIISPEEMQNIEQTWSAIRKEWQPKSLLLTTPVNKSEVSRISTHLYSYKFPVNAPLSKNFSIEEQIQLKNILATKSPELRGKILQQLLLKRLISQSKASNEGTHLFIFSPSWCESSKEYRSLFEVYLKTFRNKQFTLHSVVIEDEKEAIFSSHFFHELFPNDEKEKKEVIVPRFLALVSEEKESVVLEEADALEFVFQKYFIGSRGFLDEKLNTQKGKAPLERAIASMPE